MVRAGREMKKANWTHTVMLVAIITAGVIALSVTSLSEGGAEHNEAQCRLKTPPLCGFIIF